LCSEAQDCAQMQQINEKGSCITCPSYGLHLKENDALARNDNSVYLNTAVILYNVLRCVHTSYVGISNPHKSYNYNLYIPGV